MLSISDVAHYAINSLLTVLVINSISSRLFPIVQEVNSSAVTFVLSTRQLWVEHLEPFLSEIIELLQVFLNSGTAPLQQALRRVCAQLVDLSPSLALAITGHVIRTTVSEIKKHLEQTEGSEVNMEVEEDIDNKKLKRCVLYCVTNMKVRSHTGGYPCTNCALNLKQISHLFKTVSVVQRF